MKKFKILLLFIFFISVLLIFTACSDKKPIDYFNTYKESWESKDYEKMYSMLSQKSKDYISKDDFISRYVNIYDGIEADGINIDIKEVEKEDQIIRFSLRMNTIAGEVIQDDYEVKMVKENTDKGNQWTLEWNEGLIFPQMDKGDKVGVSFSKGKRGEIYDRSGKDLAVNGTRYNVGIHPGRYDRLSTPTLAGLLDINEEIIEKELDRNTNPEHFVPIVKLSLDNKELLNKVLEIEGVIYQEVNERVYPGGEALGSLIGYIRPITAEELEKDEDNVYTGTSIVGRFGLEEVYEKSLRPIDGAEIYISKIKDGKEVERISLVKKEAKDGKDLNVTIDMELQKKIYTEMGGDVGASTAIDPRTGEVLAMVSSPSFDSNLYTTYISNAQREKWDKMDVDVFENKFNKSYSPGSTFKLVTAAIGLERGIINPSEKASIQGKGWQKDSSWGNYMVNRVNQEISNVDLNDAIVYSDNIYFAMTAIKIGEKNFIEGAKKFGFGEDIPVGYPMANSQIVSGDKIENEILLADTGYGQGQVMLSPLHLSLVYSAMVNDGDIMEPLLETNDETKVWKEDVLSDNTRKTLLNSFINVIEDKKGTGHSGKLDNIKLAGKTGTAELKKGQEEKVRENGWFVAMDVEDPKIVISMLIENVESRGGSKYLIPKVKNVMKYYLEK